MTQNNRPLFVSALIVTRKNTDGVTEILNVLAEGKTKYGFPGGKIEENETPEQALDREVLEEIGVEPSNVKRIGMYSALTPEGREFDMYVFTGTIPDDIEPLAEIKELHWMTYQQMHENPHLLTPMTLQYVLPLLEQM